MTDPKPVPVGIYLIPPKVEQYQEGQQEHDVLISEADLLFYEPVKGETVRVLLWERYPNYDIIFGVPDKTSPKHEKEVGFFTVRRVGHLAYTGHYFDIKESQAMVEGFQRILDLSQTNSPHLWKELNERT